jgi:transposase, IS30 family
VSAYKQLSLDERYQIVAMLRLKRSVREIAHELDRHPSTIYRELKRNSEPYFAHPYLAPRAQKKTAARRIAKGEGQRKIQGELQEAVERKLRLSWSPEQICGRLRVEDSIILSHETIYQHILRDSKRLGFYRYCLRYGGYKHHRFKKSRMAEKTRARKNWIEDRPASANNRSELGHWERDCLLGKRGEAAMLTMVDRKSRYLRVIRVSRLDADTVAKATFDGLQGLPTRTITNDNGIEFQRDESLQKTMSVPIYFCNPYSPWERGSVENANGLLRQYLKKGSDFDALPSWMPSALEETINFRPRKVLGFRTPHEVLHKTKIHLMKRESMHFGLEFSGPTRFRRILARAR